MLLLTLPESMVEFFFFQLLYALDSRELVVN